MMIGGEDIILYAPSEVPATELALGRLRRFWPDAVVRDPDEETLHSIHAPWVLNRGVRSRELMIYRDEAAAASWDRDGMTPENTNDMFCLIVGEPSQVKPDKREVTLVCGERTEAIEELVRDLEADFHAVRTA
jgi:hypothetical protein